MDRFSAFSHGVWGPLGPQKWEFVRQKGNINSHYVLECLAFEPARACEPRLQAAASLKEGGCPKSTEFLSIGVVHASKSVFTNDLASSLSLLVHSISQIAYAHSNQITLQ